jgi:hypothetical protein
MTVTTGLAGQQQARLAGASGLPRPGSWSSSLPGAVSSLRRLCQPLTRAAHPGAVPSARAAGPAPSRLKTASCRRTGPAAGLSALSGRSRIEGRVTALTEAVRVLAHGLEDLPAMEPGGNRTADAARRAYDLLLAAEPPHAQPDGRPGARRDAARTVTNCEDAMASALVRVFACGDVMPGRGVDQLLPYPRARGDPQLAGRCRAAGGWSRARRGRGAGQPAPVRVPGGGRMLVLSCGTASSGIPAGWAPTPTRPGVYLLPSLSPAAADTLIAQAGSAHHDGDLVLVSIHWGSNWGYGVDRRVPMDRWQWELCPAAVTARQSCSCRCP